MKTRSLTALALAIGATALVAVAPSTGASPPIAAHGLAAGTMSAAAFRAAAGSMILESITIAPGGNFGWHAHGAAVAVVVTHGTLTVFDPNVGSCAPFKVGKGSAFVEPANHVHLARNDGSTPVSLYAMYIGLAKSAKPNVAAAAPAGCNA